MEIAPIPGIRVLPAVQAPQADFRLSEVFELEGLARPGDGSRERSRKKAAGAEEDEEDDLMLDAETADGSSSVDYFA